MSARNSAGIRGRLAVTTSAKTGENLNDAS